MFEINYLAIIAAAIAALIASMVWYIFFSKVMARLHPEAYGNMKKPQPLKMLGEIIRNLVLTSVLAYVIVLLGISTWMEVILLGLLLWIGFPVVLLIGSVIYEKVSWKLAAIHAGDWLIKILLMVTILSIWY